MEEFAAGGEDGPTFARGWLAGRRRALADGERLRATFERVLDEVFYSLDEYAIDPALRDESDVSDEALLTCVREALARLGDL